MICLMASTRQPRVVQLRQNFVPGLKKPLREFPDNALAWFRLRFAACCLAPDLYRLDLAMLTEAPFTTNEPPSPSTIAKVRAVIRDIDDYPALAAKYSWAHLADD